MPRSNRKVKPRRKGYRKRLSAPKKGCLPYKRKLNCAYLTGQEVYSERPSSSEMEITDCNVNSKASQTCCEVKAQNNTIGEEGDSVTGFKGFSDSPQQQGVRVLSLFDGIGAAKFALDCLQVPIEEYFSSEIDEKAISILKRHYFNKMTMCGCITSITGDKLKSLGRIHLLLGGSPCSDLSLCNPRRRGLHGSGSSGKLFFEYQRIRSHLMKNAAELQHDFYWLFQNTFAMETATRLEISRSLGSEPVVLCSSSDAAMKRRRCYWGNVPGLLKQTDYSGKMPSLQDVLMPYRTALVNVMPTITGSSHSQMSGKSKKRPVSEDGMETNLLIIEEERLFGFPQSYTDVNLTPTDRMKLLGRSWCIPTIVRILKPFSTLLQEGNMNL